MTELILNPQNELTGSLKGPGDEIDAVGDYSSAAVNWAWKHDDPQKAEYLAVLVRLSIMLVFREKTDVIAYGGRLGELPNGIAIEVGKSGGGTIPWLGGARIKSHVDLGMHSGAGSALQIDADTTNKNSEGYVLVRLGAPEGIRGIGLQPGDEARVVLNDDFGSTGCKLVMHRFTINGFWCSTRNCTIRTLGILPDLGYGL